MTGKRSGWGGKRNGAGRKADPAQRMIRISLAIRPELMAALQARRSATGEPVNAQINSAIAHYLAHSEHSDNPDT